MLMIDRKTRGMYPLFGIIKTSGYNTFEVIRIAN